MSGRIAVVGTGLMGASVGLGARAAGTEVRGWDSDPSSRFNPGATRFSSAACATSWPTLNKLTAPLFLPNPTSLLVRKA